MLVLGNLRAAQRERDRPSTLSSLSGSRSGRISRHLLHLDRAHHQAPTDTSAQVPIETGRVCRAIHTRYPDVSTPRRHPSLPCPLECLVPTLSPRHCYFCRDPTPSRLRASSSSTAGACARETGMAIFPRAICFEARDEATAFCKGEETVRVMPEASLSRSSRPSGVRP